MEFLGDVCCGSDFFFRRRFCLALYRIGGFVFELTILARGFSTSLLYLGGGNTNIFENGLKHWPGG